MLVALGLLVLVLLVVVCNIVLVRHSAFIMIDSHLTNPWLARTHIRTHTHTHSPATFDWSGWTGGGYGEGERMSIQGTRACIDAILDGNGGN